MKAKVKLALPGFAGNMDDMVIYYNSQLNCLIARKKPEVKNKMDGSFCQEIYAFARRIHLSAAYKADCARYIKAYNSKNRRNGRALVSWPGLWMKVMRAQARDLPELDIKELSREEAIAQDLNCTSIARAVQAGYIEPVQGCEQLTGLI
ncbi:MAG: hypothetical protein LHW56_07580 [Candidatus Cloacimonetes bacterium]|nr:hypothetical protein [Candidatus Cloacimonadota bacterium]MDY0172755.1 hypothetical protein [Candidatus Cloacimonadaceae bacterium]